MLRRAPGALVDGLLGEYDDAVYTDGVYDDEDGEEDLGGGFTEG